MAQVKAINTRKVSKVDGHTIFNMVKNMTGASNEEILIVIPPQMVPLIGRNDATQGHVITSDPTWDSPQQVSWGNALLSLRKWQKTAESWKQVEESASLLTLSNTPAVVLKVRGTAFPKLSPTEREKLGHEKMTSLMVQTHTWGDRKKAEKTYKKMSYKELEKAMLATPGKNYPFYNRATKARKAMITEHITELEMKMKVTFYQGLWTHSGGSKDSSVLMIMAQQHPIYCMAWIIAKTYHMNNPEVKNVAGYEGRYKWRNWELKERYYPAIGTGDTLPKTTAGWPRYSAAPPILNDFTMQEIANALKTNFGKVLQVRKNVDKGLIKQAIDSTNIRRVQHLQHSKTTLQHILSQGLDVWNQSNLVNHAVYYPTGVTNYANRTPLPASKIALITYADLKKKLGTSNYNRIITEYESTQKSIQDNTIKSAKAHYATTMSHVVAAKGTHSVPKRSPPKIRSQ